MAKFNITVDIDYVDEDGNLDEVLYDKIVNSVVDKVSNKVVENMTNSVKDKIDEESVRVSEKISERLNEYMEEFFEKPRNIYDKWGELVKSNTCVKEMLKEACDNFMSASVDESGKPSTSSWNNKIMSRTEYMVKKVVNADMEYAIKKATDEITKEIKEKVANEVKMQIGEKLGAFVGVDELISGKKK